MRTMIRVVAALVAGAFTFVACGIPDEPSVARQAMSTLTTPLTITAHTNDPSILEAGGVTLRVTGVDNNDWNAGQRPDSRVNGFHEVTLTQSRPSITRTFSTNALEDWVAFHVIVSRAETSAEILRVRLAYRDPQGWYVALSEQDLTPFGTTRPEGPGGFQISTTDNPAELIISDSRLP